MNITNVAFTLAFAASTAFAHGDEHAMKHAYDPATVEETGFGHAGNPEEVSRIVNVSMSDAMRFTPSDIAVKAGQTVKFVISNRGKLLHEMVIGTTEALNEHAAMMKKFPEMEHSDTNMVHVKPGTSDEIVWQFTKPGEYSFATEWLGLAPDAAGSSRCSSRQYPCLQESRLRLLHGMDRPSQGRRILRDGDGSRRHRADPQAPGFARAIRKLSHGCD